MRTRITAILLLLVLFSGCSTMMRGMMKNRMFEHYRSPLTADRAFDVLVSHF